MTATLVSLISIFIGIISANIFGFLYKKYTFEVIGNTIAGVFGSIFFIKSFGRLGFSPNFIVIEGIFKPTPFIINTIISIFGGILALIVLKKIQIKLNTDSN